MGWRRARPCFQSTGHFAPRDRCLQHDPVPEAARPGSGNFIRQEMNFLPDLAILGIGLSMSRCVYCGDRAGFWAKICADCKKLLARVSELRGHVGYGEFLDGLEQTGVSKEKILLFLRSDPDGKGSIQDQVTAEMASDLMTVMGLKGRQSPQDVKRIREMTEKESK